MSANEPADESTREARVQAKMRELIACGGDYRLLGAQSGRKRQAWWEANHGSLPAVQPSSVPRAAYELFSRRYLKLDPAEVPVVYEDGRKIVWRSFNFCPLLEACRRLDLDTRQVCREAAEESVQNLIRRLDARLCFYRNYEKGLRPYADYCEETIELVD